MHLTKTTQRQSSIPSQAFGWIADRHQYEAQTKDLLQRLKAQAAPVETQTFVQNAYDTIQADNEHITEINKATTKALGFVKGLYKGFAQLIGAMIGSPLGFFATAIVPVPSRWKSSAAFDLGKGLLGIAGGAYLGVKLANTVASKVSQQPFIKGLFPFDNTDQDRVLFNTLRLTPEKQMMDGQLKRLQTAYPAKPFTAEG